MSWTKAELFASRSRGFDTLPWLWRRLASAVSGNRSSCWDDCRSPRPGRATSWQTLGTQGTGASSGPVGWRRGHNRQIRRPELQHRAYSPHLNCAAAPEEVFSACVKRLLASWALARGKPFHNRPLNRNFPFWFRKTAKIVHWGSSLRTVKQ